MAATLTPFFSVIIPVFNRAHILGDAIRSVLAQSEQDFEIIVVDDGSRDDPKSVMDAFADERIRYARKENGGGGSARNYGIDLARGDFIAFLDSDDVFLPNHLATMRRLVEGRANVAAYAPMIVDRGEGRTFVKPPRAIELNEHMATYLFCERGFIPTITLVVPREAAARLRYDESIRFAEDSDFAIRFFLDGFAFVMAGEPGAIWRDLPNPDRSSAGRKGLRLVGWLESMKGRIPEKAYRGARGWVIAKGVAEQSPWEALRMYLSAVLHGCYRPRLAIVVFLQIFLPDRAYRVWSDRIIAMLDGAVWSRGDTRSVLPAE